MARQVTRELKPCGTTAAYDRHRRRRQKPCGPCRQANNVRKNKRYQRKNASQVAAERAKINREIRADIRKANARREIRTVQMPSGPVQLGKFAGTKTAHPHVPDGWTGTSCVLCFGWCTDPRHAGRSSLPAAVTS